jgi:hypothetical protein
MKRARVSRTVVRMASLGVAVALWTTASVPAFSAPRAAPTQVGAFRGQYCRSMGPRGWAVIAENPQRVAFGADLMSADGKAAASYAIFGAGSLNPLRGYENPDRAVASNLSRFGQEQVRFGRRMQLDQNVYAISYQTSQAEGMAFWQVIPMQAGGAMVVMRTAYAASGHWRERGAEASAVARSLRCNVPSVPAPPDPPSLNHKPAAAGGGEEGESDSLYNQWLDKEYFHNPKSGENYWVSPSSDYQQTGPQGPGYYATYGNDVIKLESGYAQ